MKKESINYCGLKIIKEYDSNNKLIQKTVFKANNTIDYIIVYDKDNQNLIKQIIFNKDIYQQ